MSLSPGTHVGPYEVIARVGAGGMGEVWKARDPRLNRDVAIKKSQDRFTGRFQREAFAIAALNHPNVCTLFDVGPDYLVMEFVEGETLAELIASGPVPLETTLRIAEQIAAALEAAHEKGIVHRDLKPANIKVRPDGSVKVLDFGLAKATEEPELAHDAQTALSSVGQMLGTAGYMSPEQARGQDVDRRTDIWAFGVVVYEMLTGKRPFEGACVNDSLAAILREQPDLTLAPVQTRRLLGRCLEKDSRRRLRDIGDALLLIDVENPVASAVQKVVPSRARLSLIAAGALLVTAGAFGVGLWRGSRPVKQPQIRLDVDLGPDVSLQTADGSSTVIIAPDGTRLVYLATAGTDIPKLFTRRLDEPRAVELPGTAGASSPFFSPDGQWVGFTARGVLHKVPMEHGSAVALGGVGYSTGSTWGDDGKIVTSSLYKGLQTSSSAGGAVTKLAEPARGEYAFLSPQILPGGETILYTVYPQPRNDADAARIEVLSVRDGHRTIVAQGGVSGRYLATSRTSGYLLYANRNNLFALPFSPRNPQKTGTPVPILDDVGFNPTTSEAQFDVSRTGTLVYRNGAASGSSDGFMSLRWVDAAGGGQPLTKPGVYDGARLSPDGRRVVVQVAGSASSGIAIYDLQRETWTNVSLDSRLYFKPVWSQDGQSIFFGSLTGLAVAQADSSKPAQMLTQEADLKQPWSMAPDGKHLICVQIVATASQLWSIPLESTEGQWKAGKPEQVITSNYSDKDPAISPDGKWLAYTSNSSGADEVYVRVFPDNGSLWKISSSGGHSPVWLRNGHGLLFQAGDQMMAVDYAANGGVFSSSKPHVWAAKVGGTTWDVSPDGKRLLVLTAAAPSDDRKPRHDIVLIQNFTDYVRQKVAVGK